MKFFLFRVEFNSDQTLGGEYRDLEDKIRYNHGAHLALIGCIDFRYKKDIHCEV